MLLFALAIHPIVQRIDADCGLIMNRRYGDDGIICGIIDQVKNALDVLSAEGQKINFLPKPTRTKAFCPSVEESALEKLLNKYPLELQSPYDGIKILGVPIGSQHFLEYRVRVKMEKSTILPFSLPA